MQSGRGLSSPARYIPRSQAAGQAIGVIDEVGAAQIYYGLDLHRSRIKCRTSEVVAKDRAHPKSVSKDDTEMLLSIAT